MRVGRTGDQLIPGSARVAEVNGIGRVVLSVDPPSPERGDVRAVFAGQARCGIDRGQYRGRIRERKHQILCSMPAHRSRLTEGSRNALASCTTRKPTRRRRHKRFDGSVRIRWKNASITYSLVAKE